MGRNIITECPACHTRFQVTQGQLKIASGKVRCGACLEVFNADVYRCDDLDDLSPLAKSQDQLFQKPVITDQSHKDPLFDLIEIPDFSPPARPVEGNNKPYSPPDDEPEQTADQISDQQSRRHARQQLPQQLPGLITRQKSRQPQNGTEERLPETEADAINHASPQLQAQPLQPASESPNLDQPVSALLHLAEQSQSPEQPFLIDAEDRQTQSLPTRDTETLFSEPESNPEPKPEPKFEPKPESEPESELEPESASPPHTASAPDTIGPASDSNAAILPGVSITTKTIESKPDRAALHSASPFRAEPVMIRTTQEKNRSHAGWIVLSMLAAILLATQYLWFNRQHLSSYPELTPVYTLACEYLPCHLKTPIMLDQISTNKLVIQEHSQYQGVLNVNLLLENRADADQPYPAILLAFSDRLGKLISERVFQPEDYLDSPDPHNSDTTIPVNMPAGQTVQIHFDILDPGRRALSYEVSLRAPAPAKKDR